MDRLTPTVEFDIFISISHLLVCRYTLEFPAKSVLNNANALSLGTNNCKKKERSHFEQRISSKNCVTLTVVS